MDKLKKYPTGPWHFIAYNFCKDGVDTSLHKLKIHLQINL